MNNIYKNIVILANLNKPALKINVKLTYDAGYELSCNVGSSHSIITPENSIYV